MAPYSDTQPLDGELSVDEVEVLLSSAFGSVRIEDAPTGSLPVRLTSIDLGSFRLDRVEARGRFSAVATAFTNVTFCTVRRGSMRTTTGGATYEYVAGESWLGAVPGSEIRARFDDTIVETVSLSPHLFGDLMGDIDSASPTTFTDFHALPAATARHWQSTARYARRQASENIEFAEQPLVLGAVARLLAATALSAFPNTTMTAVADRHHAHPASLRRAIAYVESNVADDITVTDIAAATHVSVRTLQLAFRRYLDTTPMGYLRDLRLEYAHDELLAADADRTSVTDVALQWGFGDSSRFARWYRERFRESPGQTLHQ